MSDMYLTKVERRTIFTQGLIYVLFVFIISDLTVVGPHVFVVFPWLYILGIFGVNKFYHPVLTVALSCITTFMANLFKYNIGIQTLTSTLVSTLVVVFGIITGLCIKDFVLENRLVKYLSWKKKLLNVLLIVTLTLSTFSLYAYQYGNIVSYIKSQKMVESFASDFSNEYSVKKYQYVYGTFNEYVYKLNVLEKEVMLKVKDTVSVVNLDEWQEFLNSRIELNAKLLAEEVMCDLKYEFTNNTLKPESILAVISLPALAEDDTLKVENAVEDIQTILNYTDEFEVGVENCILIIGKSVQTLNKEEFNLVNVDYLIQSSKVENLEEN